MSLEILTSLQNPRIKRAQKLRDARARREANLIVIDGAREIARARAAGVRLVEIFACPELLHRADALALWPELLRSQPCFQVAPLAFEKLAFGARAEGLVAVAETPDLKLENFPTGRCPLLAVVEQVEKPGNLGAIARSADGAGLDGLLISDPRTDVFNPNAIRASLGTLFTLPLASATALEIRDWLRARNMAIYLTRPDATRTYAEVDFRGPSAIVLGSEAHGLSRAWSGPEVQAIALPMLGSADSLNVSAAAAILFYEARRQRGFHAHVASGG